MPLELLLYPAGQRSITSPEWISLKIFAIAGMSSNGTSCKAILPITNSNIISPSGGKSLCPRFRPAETIFFLPPSFFPLLPSKTPLARRISSFPSFTMETFTSRIICLPSFSSFINSTLTSGSFNSQQQGRMPSLGNPKSSSPSIPASLPSNAGHPMRLMKLRTKVALFHPAGIPQYLHGSCPAGT